MIFCSAMTLVAFILGILIDRVYQNDTFRKVSNVIKLCSIPLLAIVTTTLMLYASYKKEAYDLIIIVLMAVLLMQLLVRGDNKKGRLSDRPKKMLKFISGCTFPLYLVHYSIIEFLLKLDLGGNTFCFIICFVTSNIVSIIFFLLVSWCTKKNDK